MQTNYNRENFSFQERKIGMRKDANIVCGLFHIWVLNLEKHLMNIPIQLTQLFIHLLILNICIISPSDLGLYIEFKVSFKKTPTKP